MTSAEWQRAIRLILKETAAAIEDAVEAEAGFDPTDPRFDPAE